MKTEVAPQDTNRAQAFELWMKSPMPMVTLTKTLDVTHILRMSRRKGLKFNMLLCWCIGKAASGMREFYMLPTDDKMCCFDSLAVNVIVQTKGGGIATCDVPFTDNLRQFNADYMQLTRRVSDTAMPHDLSDRRMSIGTSAMPQCEIDSVVNQYSGRYNNPFIAWGRYRRRILKTLLPISLQFHHAQMDGGHAAVFLSKLQETIKEID
ncbi:MAG: chloramphenicol acetyltransferase [Bacteroidaceae bacterium]|nr:chloramphenicol acetyltransferase [Bacteroidaceae bacterium]MBP5731326.1 chloramphenicol acetyltransferase [Bacteroidaceae bacterium]